MRTRNSLLLITGCLAGTAAASPITPYFADRLDLYPGHSGNQVTLGVIVNDEDSFRLGEYDGLTEDGAYAVGDFFIDGALVESDITYTLEASDLGLDSRQMLGRLGFTGGINVEFAYRELPHYRHGSLLTPYLDSASNTWSLPADWVAGETISDMTALQASTRSFDANSKRRRFDIEVMWPVNEHWRLTADYRHEHRRGRQLSGVLFGQGATQLAIRVPGETERNTQEAGLTLGYTDTWGSVTGGYRLSMSDEESKPLTLQNPFDRREFRATVDYPNGFGRLAAYPDNVAHTLHTNAAFRLSRTTRLSIDLSRSRHEQDETYLPFTVNPELNAPEPPPATDLDGELVVTQANLSLTGRPTPRTNLLLRYRYNDRDNRTDRLVYATVVNDIANQIANPAASDVRVNRPGSRKRTTIDLEGGYRLASGWKLSAGLSRENIEREFLEVDETEEDSAHIKLAYRAGTTLSGWLKWQQARRTGDDYDHNAPHLAGHAPEFTEANGADSFVNDPALRKFFLADRKRNQYDLLANWTPAHAIAISLKLNRIEDNYDKSVTGLTDMDMHTVALDLTYAPTERLSMFAYAGRSASESDQRGYQWLGFQPEVTLPPLRDDTTIGWGVASDAASDTLAVGMQWTDASERISLDFDFAHTSSVTEYAFAPGSELLAAPLPDLDTTWRDITLRGRYQWRDDVSFALEYRYRNYSDADFALDGVSLDTDDSVLYSAARAEDFEGSTLLLSVSYRFGRP